LVMTRNVHPFFRNKVIAACFMKMVFMPGKRLKQTEGNGSAN